MSILPNRVLGVVGDHEDFPIENMSKSRCGRWLVSCGHDQKVKFWDLKDVEKERVDTSKKAKKLKTLKPLSSTATRNDFFSDFAASADAPEASGASENKKSNTGGKSSDSDSSSESDDEAVGDVTVKAECDGSDSESHDSESSGDEDLESDEDAS